MQPAGALCSRGQWCSQSVARARAAVGLGLHPATLPRQRARCSRFDGGWRRLAGVWWTLSFLTQSECPTPPYSAAD
eukprot:gene13871-biopygen18589